MIDLIVCGLGSAADALNKTRELCIVMKEAQATCTRVQARLEDILEGIRKMEEQNMLPPSSTLNKYTGVIANFYEYLQRHRGKPLLMRVVRHHAIVEELRVIQQDVATLFSMLYLGETASMLDQWETDRRIQVKMLEYMVDSPKEVLHDLQKSRSQYEALMTLTYELRRHASLDPNDIMLLMKKLRKTVIRATDVEVRPLPVWYLPYDQIKFEPKSFGYGSFGTVHRGVWGSRHDTVVKCFIIEGSQMNTRIQNRIEEEISVWNSLDHPNLIKMFGASHVSSPPFFVSEYASNGNLGSFLARSSNMSNVWRLLYQAALGLEHLHQHGIVHGDLKLSNILVSGDGIVKLSDFSLKFVRTCSMMSRDFIKSPKMPSIIRWRAPECLRSRPTLLSDIYSLAMCIIEAFDGCPPFNHLRTDDLVREALREGERPEQPKMLDNAAWELVEAMTTTDPKLRMPLAQVIAKLKAFADVGKGREGVQQTEEVVVERGADDPSAPSSVPNVCRGCNVGLPSNYKFCARCGVRVEASP